jgi:hypothetical protein
LYVKNRILFRVENYAYYTILFWNNTQQELIWNLGKEGNGGRQPSIFNGLLEERASESRMKENFVSGIDEGELERRSGV